MREWIAGRRVVFASMFVFAASQLEGCGKSEGTPPPPPPPATVFSVLVSPETLHTWVTSGYGTDTHGNDRMVVLDVASAAGYATPGHVPGALLLSTAGDLTKSRNEGIGGTYSYTDGTGTYTEINAPAEVATADMMNALVQRTGITATTAVVLTGDSLLNMGMAYFNFRYWGFPRERLRVLDRTNAAYATAGFTLETTTPAAPTPSTYTVCSLAQNLSLRASLSDMIQVAEGAVANATAWDVRTADEYNGVAGKTAGPFLGRAGYVKKVAFEGHIKGAVNLPYNDAGLLGDAGARILDAATATATLGAKGITGDVTTHVYCRTSMRAAVSFLMLDGMLGYPVRLYDAAWIEWGQMATSAKSGGLAPDSPWRTDRADRSAAVNYSVDNALEVEVLLGADSYAGGTDLVMATDSAACGG